MEQILNESSKKSTNETLTPPSFDYQFIDVNITSSSPPPDNNNHLLAHNNNNQSDTNKNISLYSSPNTNANQCNKLLITRTNSAKNPYTTNRLSNNNNSTNRNDNIKNRKLSTIMFQEPSVIKRPNSTIGIPTSMLDTNNLNTIENNIDYFNLYIPSNSFTPIETPESDVSIGFNPILREKASSLTLPDQRLQCLRKGSSNPFLTTNKGNYNCNAQRTSIILNGNILHSISPIPPGRVLAPNSTNQLSVYVPDTNNNVNNSNANITESRLFNSALKARGSTISSMTNHRSSYIGDEEHYHLQQQYFATTGRKDTIISIGKNFQIQFKNPSTNWFSWRYRTGLEKFLLFILFVSLIIFLAYIYLPYITENEDQIKVCTSMECVKTAASLLNAMDLTADPCEDFFQFACGNWVKKHVIPEDRSSLSTFEVMADDLQIILKDLLEQVPNSGDNSATLKAKRFYQSCMNTQRIDDIGVQPLLDTIKEVGGWPVLDPNWNGRTLKKTLIASANGTTISSTLIAKNEEIELTIENLLGKLRGDFNQPIIVEQYVGPDDRNSSLNIIQFDQTSLGLPSREYFLKESPNKEKDAYLELMVDIAELLGAERNYALEHMTKVLEFETQLANISMAEADRHDTSAIYNKKTIKQIKQLVPEFDWIVYLKNFMPINISQSEEVVVYSLDYYRKMGKLLKKILTEDRRIVINYAVWRLLKSILPFLDDEFGVKRAKFRKILFGISADRTRWSQCVELVNKKMGMAVGALFIRENFDPKSKEIALEMIHNIREAFNELLKYNNWMDDEMRQVAKEKADSINERIGYPELLTNPIQLSKEYNFLEINDDKFLQNILNVFRFESYKNLMKLGKAVDMDSWITDPAVVNAFYSPNKNDIVFPAGILQPLFYSHYFPKSLNYGGIGVVIGHEITHGFDDRGRQFDKNGNMKQWWNNRTIQRFRERAQCIIDQYSSYVLEDINANVNGRMTQGENIADNGGLKQAYRAFKKWEKHNGIEPLLPGLNFTHDQLFFLNYAQIWCGSMRPEDALNKIRSSVHSPGPIRVLGSLSNSYDFSAAYHCKAGARMNPIKKCSVW